MKYNKQTTTDAKTWKDLEKNIPNSRLECKIHTLLETKMAKIDTLFPQLYSQALFVAQASEKALGTRLLFPTKNIYMHKWCLNLNTV